MSGVEYCVATINQMMSIAVLPPPGRTRYTVSFNLFMLPNQTLSIE